MLEQKLDLSLLIEQLAQSVALKLEPLLRQEQPDQWLTVKEAGRKDRSAEAATRLGEALGSWAR